MIGDCPLCQRTLKLTFHHLIPKKCHRRNFFRRHFSREELQKGIYLCRQCHNGIHRHYSEMELGKILNTLDALKADERIMRHSHWVAKQKVAQ